MASVARGYLEGLILYDQILIRRGLVPKLYQAFLRGELEFRNEPNAGEFEEFADAHTCYERGWADCDDLVPWRCAEWREYKGVLARPKIYWRERSPGVFSYHAEVRLPCKCHGRHDCQDAPVEDVSTFLGMSRRPRGRRAA